MSVRIEIPLGAHHCPRPVESERHNLEQKIDNPDFKEFAGLAGELESHRM